MKAFTGKQECSVDDKRRLSLPPPCRPLFGQRETPSGYTLDLVVLPWYHGPLVAAPMPAWDSMASRILNLDFTIPDFLQAKRLFFSKADYTHTDPEGRITLIPEHAAWLRLNPSGKDRVMVVGAGNLLEIWNVAEWREYERTGMNPAARPAADVQYEKLLHELMLAAAKGTPAGDIPGPGTGPGLAGPA